MSVVAWSEGPVRIVSIDRPQARNAVDGTTARALFDSFLAFDADDSLSVAILTGAGGAFCAGADLKGVAQGRGNPVEAGGASARWRRWGRRGFPFRSR